MKWLRTVYVRFAVYKALTTSIHFISYKTNRYQIHSVNTNSFQNNLDCNAPNLNALCILIMRTMLSHFNNMIFSQTILYTVITDFVPYF